MKRTVIITAVIPLVITLAACDQPAVTEPGDEAPLFAMTGPGRQILMLDACDPVSFNAALGPGTCSRGPAGGGIPFATFVGLLQEHQQVDAWRFSPATIRVATPTTFSVPNHGGIPHSFTEVAEFGGGFVPFLNALSGNPVPAPECLDFANMNLIAPGDHDMVTMQPGESKKYMCCIHPWMRAVTE
jgi:hypothetical protein